MCDASCGTSPQSVLVAIVPVASYPVETKRSSARLVESRVNIVSVPSASGAINDQVELLNRRNHVRMNICHRYATLAELCTVFGIEKQSSKKERQERKSKMTTNTKDRSLASIPSSKDISRPQDHPLPLLLDLLLLPRTRGTNLNCYMGGVHIQLTLKR